MKGGVGTGDQESGGNGGAREAEVQVLRCGQTLDDFRGGTTWIY